MTCRWQAHARTAGCCSIFLRAVPSKRRPGGAAARRPALAIGAGLLCRALRRRPRRDTRCSRRAQGRPALSLAFAAGWSRLDRHSNAVRRGSCAGSGSSACCAAADSDIPHSIPRATQYERYLHSALHDREPGTLGWLYRQPPCPRLAAGGLRLTPSDSPPEFDVGPSTHRARVLLLLGGALCSLGRSGLPWFPAVLAARAPEYFVGDCTQRAVAALCRAPASMPGFQVIGAAAGRQLRRLTMPSRAVLRSRLLGVRAWSLWHGLGHLAGASAASSRTRQQGSRAGA